jgi:putative SOS response-associated peptidase YedK
MSIGTRTLNAWWETITKTLTFRESILTKPCVMPTDVFYERRKMGAGEVVPSVAIDNLTVSLWLAFHKTKIVREESF